MTLLFLLLQAALVEPSSLASDRGVAPVALSQVSDESLKQLATNESRLPGRLGLLIYDDPSMRAEIKRVGFEKGCRAIAESRREISLQFVPALVPATVQAIRKIVPEPQLSQIRGRSFVSGPLHIYANRIDNEIDRTASSTLSAAYEAMRTAFLTRTNKLPTTQNPADNIIMPKADIAAFGNLTGPYDLDNPAHLRMACADLLIAPGDRPTITTSPASQVFTVNPSQQ